MSLLISYTYQVYSTPFYGVWGTRYFILKYSGRATDVGCGPDVSISSVDVKIQSIDKPKQLIKKNGSDDERLCKVKIEFPPRLGARRPLIHLVRTAWGIKPIQIPCFETNNLEARSNIAAIPGSSTVFSGAVTDFDARGGSNSVTSGTLGQCESQKALAARFQGEFTPLEPLPLLSGKSDLFGTAMLVSAQIGLREIKLAGGGLWSISRGTCGIVPIGFALDFCARREN
ncbi:hypothetical protein CIHG_00775 [Coccidioides immitis H538.4]|uniref:Uncharacterized protein n=2 Tax=Coccidioides immitis TaxID=5501 RepID=A0A0J8U7I7_COCIT|nr:hypothetical protein CIRG_03193 [Coccidioides immitis RMSCC 2394]KMU82993.1 hypothetical protein CIHG_00775 [Coccidioides immitis H538.4]